MLNVKRVCITLGIICLFIGSFVGVYVFEYKGDTNISKPIEEKEPVEEQPKPKEYIDYLEVSKVFELPIDGASGYASVDIELRDSLDDDSNLLGTIKAGEGFTILGEDGDYFKINYNDKIGYVKHSLCFINLPDVLPSIVYNITNAKGSQMVSSGENIPNVTGEILYNAYQDNPRFNTKEYIVPVLYSMAKKIAIAEQNALKENNTLIIYEAYRPYEVQRRVVNNLYNLSNTNPTVKAGITTAPWTMTWFIATGMSNHQRGCAIDVSLGKVNKLEEKTLGDYKYKDVTEYEEYEMYSKMHELSIASTIFKYPVDSFSKEAWRNAPLNDNVNPEAKLLQTYCTSADLSPLASEWWHFNDLDSLQTASSKGEFLIEKNYSMPLEETNS